MEKIHFVKIIDSENVEDIEALEINAKKKSHIFDAPTAKINRDGHVILDFGKEICGRVHVVYSWNDGDKVRIRTGESVAETCAELGEKGACNDHSLRDAVYPSLKLSDFSTTETGFRFVRLDSLEGTVKIISIYAEETPNGLNRIGDFECNDEEINKIFKVAVRTLSLCTRDEEIWDAIKRDRIVWIGDFYPELIGLFPLYGDIKQFKNVFDSFGSFDKRWANGLPSYSAWWLLCLCEYYELSGDKDYFLSKIDDIRDVIDAFDSIIKENGRISPNDGIVPTNGDFNYFIDWPSNQTKDSEIGWRYLIIMMLRKAKTVLSGFDEDVSKIEAMISRLSSYSYEQSSFKQVTALGVLADMIDGEKAKELLKKDGAMGMTCFMSAIIMKALMKLGEGEFALETIKEYYGAMLKMGATTFFEDFDMEWLKDDPDPITEMPKENKKNIHADYGKFCYKGLRHSLCHGWSSGFISFFFDYILGVTALEPGYKTISVVPHLSGLAKANGIIATPYGPIKVSHELIDGKVHTELDLPKGVQISDGLAK